MNDVASPKRLFRSGFIWKPAGMILATFLLALPVLIWRQEPARELRVLIIDKSVPDITRREHAGLVWTLRHLKFQKPGGEDFSRNDDYYGFVPLPNRNWMAREPSIQQSKPELIYFADTYGVYSNDFLKEPPGTRNRLLHGGLRIEEIQDLQAALPGCLTLIGEFNTFAGPTEPPVRKACEELFGLTWSGWTARFFKDLDRWKEIPTWAIRNWERQTGQEWTFAGPGFLLVNQDQRVEVLAEGRDVEPKRGLRFHGLPAGISNFDLPKDARYDFWFDLVEPRPGTQVLAEYEFPVLPAGEQKLKALGIKTRTAAILTSWKEDTRVCYFSGDFADLWPEPTMHRVAGYAQFHRQFDHEIPGEGRTFFWRVYVPMMTRLLEDTWTRKHAK
jgi:hypothetical protein